MILTCIIIDDEPLAVSLIESYVLKTPFLRLKAKFSSAIDASEIIRTDAPDILFLDIQMPELNGMDFARIVSDKTRIIFTTAFQQYAIEGYKVNALDYLLKPFSYKEFLQATDKALRWFEKINAIEKENSKSIFIKSDYKLIQIELDKILYVEGLKDYVKIYIENQTSPIISHITMKAMEDMLSEKQFIRVHRSFIVQQNKIKIVEHNRIVFGKVYIPISDSYKNDFQVFLNNKMI